MSRKLPAELLTPADRWQLTAIAQEEQDRFLDRVHTNKHTSYAALGILAARQHCQPYLGQAGQQLTFVDAHPAAHWPGTVRQVICNLRDIGFPLRSEPIDSLVASNKMVRIEGELPPPNTLLDTPELASLRGIITHETSIGWSSGVRYMSFSSQITNGYVVGHANPFTGERLEFQLEDLTALRQQYQGQSLRPDLPRTMFF